MSAFGCSFTFLSPSVRLRCERARGPAIGIASTETPGAATLGSGSRQPDPRALVEHVARRAETESKWRAGAEREGQSPRTAPIRAQCSSRAAFVMTANKDGGGELSAWVPIHATGGRG